MRSLTAPRRARHRAFRDPAPSKWGYRWQRLMLTPGVRAGLRIGTPLALLAAVAGIWFADPDNRAMLVAQVDDMKAAFQQRPEFMLTRLEITGADTALAAEVTEVLPVDFPLSSFDLDLEEMRATVAALNAVADVRLRIGEAGALQVDVTPRVPVALWRARDTLKLIDAGGVFAGVVAARADRLDLPLIAGDGAQDHIAEALAIFASAGPVAPRVRGLVRMGERRWDMVLDRDQRILLPETGAVAAIDRVIALNGAQDLLDRDVTVIDMRNPARATIRMNAEAAAAMRRVSDQGADE